MVSLLVFHLVIIHVPPVGSTSQFETPCLNVRLPQSEESLSSFCLSGLDLPFMMMPHPLLPMGLPPASVAMAMSQMNHLSTIANMAAAAQQIHTHVHRAPVIKVTRHATAEDPTGIHEELLCEKSFTSLHKSFIREFVCHYSAL